MYIIITGCNGTLGRFLYNSFNRMDHNHVVVPNTRDMCDLSNYENIELIYGYNSPNMIVHCAAYTNVQKSDTETQKVFNDNILASINLIRFAMKNNSKFVFISTDFVFDGRKGFYQTDDLINPQTVYAKSKASIELALSCYANSLIIRTSFFKESFPFEKACTDRFTSKDYIDVIGPLILDIIMSDRTGVVHVGTERKSFYELAKRRKAVEPITCIGISTINKDHSLICETA